MNVLKALPPEAAALPAKAQWKFWLLANRVQLGVLLLAVTAAFSTMVAEGNEAAHKWIHVVELLIVLVTGASGGGLVGAGAFKSNGEHEQQMNRQIKQTTGSYPVVRLERRAAHGRSR